MKIINEVLVEPLERQPSIFYYDFFSGVPRLLSTPRICAWVDAMRNINLEIFFLGGQLEFGGRASSSVFKKLKSKPFLEMLRTEIRCSALLKLLF